MVRRPARALAPFVARIGYFESQPAPGREIRLPNGCPHLVINLDEDEIRWYEGPGFRTARRITGGAAFGGAFASPVGLDLARQRLVYVGFRPGGAYPFFAPPAHELAAPVVDLAELWGADGATLRERLLCAGTPDAALRAVERLLIARPVRPLLPDPAMAHAAAALGRGAPVTAVGDELGMSHSRLLRRFTERIGMTPKRYARVRRLHRLLTAIPYDAPVDWAAAAHAAGYSDQAHLIHEFRALAGITPSVYRARSVRASNHIPLSDEFFQSPPRSGAG